MSKNVFNKSVDLKTVLIIVGVVLALVIGVGALTAGFTRWTPGVNEDNFYNADVCSLTSQTLDNGVTIEVNEDGVITLNGTANADKDVHVGTVILKSGKYNLTAIKGASINTVYMTATVDNVEIKFDFTENAANILEVAADNTAVTLSLHLVEGAEFSNVSVKPVIVAGEESGSFYG